MTVTVVDAPEQSRFKLWNDDALIGLADYVIEDGTITFTHTEVNTDRRNKGLGATLVGGALDQVRSEGTYRVVAACPFVAHFITENTAYQELLAA